MKIFGNHMFDTLSDLSQLRESVDLECKLAAGRDGLGDKLTAPRLTRKGSNYKSEFRLLPRRGSRQIAQGVGLGTRANPGWGIPPIRAPEGRPEANCDGQAHSARPVGAPVDFSAYPGLATRASSLHPGLTSDRPSRAQIEWRSSEAASCKDDLQVRQEGREATLRKFRRVRTEDAQLLCRSALLLHAFRQSASLRRFRIVRTEGTRQIPRKIDQVNSDHTLHVCGDAIKLQSQKVYP